MWQIIGLAIFAVSLPAFYVWMSGSLAQRRIGWFCIGLAPFVISPLHLEVSIISWAMWPGYVKGMIVTLLDSLALAIVLTQREPARGRPLLWAYLLFLVGSGVATLFASPWQASFFFSWQLARAVLVFVAVSKVTARSDGVRYLIGGLALGIAIQAVFSIEQRLQGVTQASGLMGHQNLLGLCTHFALLMSLAAMLAGDRRMLLKVGVFGAMIAVVLTGSRATTALAGVGVVVLIGMSMLRRPTAFKTQVAGIGLALLAVGTPIALATLHTRFQADQNPGNYDERAAFERAARAMWTDNPMGVGGNQYVVKSNTGGYSQRAGVIWSSASRGANVHNTYLLLGTETGYLGLGTFLILLVASIVRGMQLAWARPRGGSGEIALGATVALLVVALHCFYEWVFVTWNVQYLFAITLGIVAGVAKQQQVARRERGAARARAADPVVAAPAAWSPPLPA